MHFAAWTCTKTGAISFACAWLRSEKNSTRQPASSYDLEALLFTQVRALLRGYSIFISWAESSRLLGFKFSTYYQLVSKSPNQGIARKQLTSLGAGTRHWVLLVSIIDNREKAEFSINPVALYLGSVKLVLALQLVDATCCFLQFRQID
jgi:hypothetical protein